MENRKTAKEIVRQIKLDLTDRRGLRQEWEQIDQETQNQIVQGWEDICVLALAKAIEGRAIKAKREVLEDIKTLLFMVSKNPWPADLIMERINHQLKKLGKE